MVVPVTNRDRHCRSGGHGGWIFRVADPTRVLWLLCAAAVVAAAFTGVGLALGRRNRRRTRGVFVLGVVCGVMAGPMLLRRSRGLRALRAATRAVDGTHRFGRTLAVRRQPSRR
jgi:hypothetical protein